MEALNALQSGLLDIHWLAFDAAFWDPDVDVINWIDPVNPGHWPFSVNGYKIFGEPILLGFNWGDEAREYVITLRPDSNWFSWNEHVVKPLLLIISIRLSWRSHC